ncbi:hypothetical protein Tco_1044830 [Tanacetum coccineum]|uniref:Uncharacterized protein n=1 Tax=Tanacetum coccineum TaxID=301880 RepID=A0ABQ5GS30_9ASTR
MVIEEPEYGIFFTDEFGDQAFQRWSDIDKVGMEAVKPKQAEKPRITTQNPKVDKRDWNGKMTQKPGLGFESTKKAFSAVKGNWVTAVKASVGCVWRPKMTDLNNVSKDNSRSGSPPKNRVNYIDPQRQTQANDREQDPSLLTFKTCVEGFVDFSCGSCYGVDNKKRKDIGQIS